ncbi:MAG TPA: DUF1634 domain-containing protein [Symbiobacteriaceae bacterium]|jgi:uncharacterized membrane protein|nr:DUF1634 domain-containing protein [Symbiobacteriaceae bacterium]
MEMTHGKESRVDSMEIILARLLRIGSMIAAGLMAAGIVLMVTGVALGGTLVLAGLLTLVSTPVIRVLAAMIVFLRERDYLFAGFCAVVILSLAVGMFIGNLE